jgi:hypothetical protein
VSKTYNTVWTTGLICKLHAAGIPYSSPLLLASYLIDRKFKVKMEGKFSEWKPIRVGVPQGAVLAPLLYSLHVYVTDIPRRTGIETSKFADNSAAFT